MRYEKYQFRAFEDRPDSALHGMVVADMKEASRAFSSLFPQAQASEPEPVAREEIEAALLADQQAVEEARRIAYDEGFSAGMHQGLEDGYAKGFAAGTAEEKQLAEVRQAEAVEKAVSRHHHALEAAFQSLNLQLMQAFSEATEQAEHQQQDALRLALAIGRKLAGAALDRFPMDTLLPLIQQAIAAQHGVAEMHVHLHPELLPMMEPQLERLAKEAGFRGVLLCHAREGMALGESTISWQHGRLTRELPPLMQEIEAMIERSLPPEKE